MNDSIEAAERQTRIPVATAATEYTIEEALVHVGHGWMQRWLLVVLGASCATYSANVVLMSFLEPNVCCLVDILSLLGFHGSVNGIGEMRMESEQDGRDSALCGCVAWDDCRFESLGNHC